jgi:hypothetical protein
VALFLELIHNLSKEIPRALGALYSLEEEGESCAGRPKPETFDILKTQEEVAQRRLEAMRRASGLWAKDEGQ